MGLAELLSMGGRAISIFLARSGLDPILLRATGLPGPGHALGRSQRACRSRPTGQNTSPQGQIRRRASAQAPPRNWRPAWLAAAQVAPTGAADPRSSAPGGVP